MEQEQVIYRVNAHDVLNGATHREVARNKRDAIFQAERLFNRGAYLWVDVVAKDRRGRITIPHHVERTATDAERSAIATRYSTQGV